MVFTIPPPLLPVFDDRTTLFLDVSIIVTAFGSVFPDFVIFVDILALIPKLFPVAVPLWNPGSSDDVPPSMLEPERREFCDIAADEIPSFVLTKPPILVVCLEPLENPLLSKLVP
jgi:hypothetical protein